MSEIEGDAERQLILKSKDLDLEESFKSAHHFFKERTSESELVLLKEALLSFFDSPEELEAFLPLQIEAFLNEDVGAGLGGSSALLISILKSASVFLKKPLNEDTLIERAKNVETRILAKPAGIQDYYPAVYGGLGALFYTEDGIRRELCDESSLRWLENHLSLIDSGKPHHSGMENWEIYKKHMDGDKNVIQALDAISTASQLVWMSLQKKDLQSLAIGIRQEWEARKTLSLNVSTPEIEELEVICSDAGAFSFKVCGAGGGGVVLCLSEDRAGFEDKLEKSFGDSGVRLLNYQVATEGLKSR
jgi:D-glycero-alpha-D-manno-heptose-7-phosphate kinase